MKLRFESDQEYQLKAISAVAELFDGQPRSEAGFVLAGSGLAAVANRLDLEDDELLANLQAVQEEGKLTKDSELRWIEESIGTAEGELQARWANFSVEMETGTGKTYVYIRTALELSRRYGLRKFIIVVPSVAIREGVLKTLEMTDKHLHELYDNAPYRYYPYDSGNLNILRQFALSDGVEMLVMTIDSFNKASNIINQDTDHLQGETPIHLVQTTRPILILDEPQNMESELSVRALSALDPLFALRYSATHRDVYNLVYRLTPFEAYRQELVKRIEVQGVESEADANQVFMRLASDGIRTGKRAGSVSAKLTVHKLMAKNAVKQKTVTVKPGDSLRTKTGLPLYEGFDVDEITPGYGVRFSNDVEIRLDEARGSDKEAIFEAQIRSTVEGHLRKQSRLTDIKVLSLFFVDRVDSYASNEGIVRKLFDKAFEDLKGRFPGWEQKQAADVRKAYFAQKRTKGDKVVELDSSGETDADNEAYDIIMRDKERLLSFDEPTAFIFSHSALREGWDNPNVFQICTLNQSVSETRKRQEVGRGVRLAVNQNGERVRDPVVNVLTVVANESYEKYVKGLQKEIEDEYGAEGTPPKPGDARKRGVATLRKSYLLKPEFKTLWDLIKQKTRYSILIDTEELLSDVVPRLNATEIKPLRVIVRKGRLNVGEGDEFGAQQVSATRTVDLDGRSPLPNLIDTVAYLLEQTRPPIRLTRKTIFECFARCDNQEAALSNPHDWSTAVARIVRDRLAEQIVSGIQYEKTGEWYELTQLQDEIESWKQYLVPTQDAIYDHVVFDSKIERQFVEALEARDDVKLYLKLPSWFTVPTPVGEYNPDWAVVREELDDDGGQIERIYLVAETKGTTDLATLRPSEQRKVACGKKHFEDALGVTYVVATTADKI